MQCNLNKTIMDSDIQRSLRLLESAVSTPGKGLFKTPTKSTIRKKRHDTPVLTLPEDLSHSEDFRMEVSSASVRAALDTIMDSDKTLTGQIIRSEEPWEDAGDNLHTEFFEIMQANIDSNDVLQLLSDLTTCCSDTLNVIKGLKSKVNVDFKSDSWLENERNTWRLLYILYTNRLAVETMQPEDEFQCVQYQGRSEKRCMQVLFKQNNLVRETQLVIDWLECNANERDDEALHFSDNTSAWENTYHQLKSADTIVFKSDKELVKSLHPDAPEYEDKCLHDLDLQDDKNLSKRVFIEIRCGKLKEAQKLCKDCGHPWIAALFEGWKLYHNPHYTSLDDEPEVDDFLNESLDMNMPIDQDVDYNENRDIWKSIKNKLNRKGRDNVDSEDFYQYINLKVDTKHESKLAQLEGNESRDVWKKMAWQFARNENLDLFRRASIAAYCGNLQTLIDVSNSWEDYLWAYFKVMIDIKVESEIRENVNKNYVDMPEEYWKQKMSINEAFCNLEGRVNGLAKEESTSSTYVILKHVILDQISELYKLVDELADDSNVSTHYLRFLAHLVLFFEQIGRSTSREVTQKVLEKYIRRLMEKRDTQLVAFYVSKLIPKVQLHLYSGYLENIVPNDERKAALEYGRQSGLDIFAISKQIVENIRAKPQYMGSFDNLQQKITPLDEFKISCVDWLLLYDQQRAEALIQANSLIFTFITMKKLDAAQAVFNKLPSDIVDNILSMGTTDDSVHQGIREHLSYKAYLEAQEAFSVWYQSFKSCPLPPASLCAHAQFTERVAHEHRVSQHRADVGRWRITIAQHMRTARTLLYDVLLFPGGGGWLAGATDAAYLRTICLPECALLLAHVLHESGENAEVLQLADVVASEKYGLYKVFSKEKRMEIFLKIAESSCAFLKEKKDPWGEEPII